MYYELVVLVLVVVSAALIIGLDIVIEKYEDSQNDYFDIDSSG